MIRSRTLLCSALLLTLAGGCSTRASVGSGSSTAAPAQSVSSAKGTHPGPDGRSPSLADSPAALLPASMRCALGDDRDAALQWAYRFCAEPPEDFGGIWPYSFEWRGCVHHLLDDQCGDAPRSDAALQGRALEFHCVRSAPSLSLTGCALRHAASVRESYQARLAVWASASTISTHGEAL